LQGQYHGWFPDPTTMPRLTPTLVTVLGGTLPTDKEHYYPAFGNVIYQVSDWNSGATTNHFAKFAHQFASWGQSLSVNWSYVGGTTMLKVSGTDYVWLFPGLQITINNGGGNVDYLVTGVYPLTSTTAQLSVLNLSGGESTWNLLAGTVGTTYTGSTITQAAYTIAQF
jgi:hypothetical protein